MNKEWFKKYYKNKNNKTLTNQGGSERSLKQIDEPTGKKEEGQSTSQLTNEVTKPYDN